MRVRILYVDDMDFNRLLYIPYKKLPGPKVSYTQWLYDSYKITSTNGIDYDLEFEDEKSYNWFLLQL